MAIVRLFLPLEKPLDRPPEAVHVPVVEVLASVEPAAFRTVTESCQFSDGSRLRPSAVVGDLVGRPGRAVTTWLAWAGGAPCGLAALVEAGAGPLRRHSIAWLLVSDAARRRGVGRALVGAAVARARARGARELWVETRGDWSAALAFWRSVGFRAPP